MSGDSLEKISNKINDKLLESLSTDCKAVVSNFASCTDGDILAISASRATEGSNKYIIIGIAIVLFICCCIYCCCSSSGMYYWNKQQNIKEESK